MQEVSLEGHQGRPAVIDLCHPCQAFWFDSHESLRLTPGSTLSLLRMIGERAAAPRSGGLDAATCPRCGARLQRTRDMQRTTRFEYLRCPNGHGRFTSFFEFLKEKDFVRPLTAQQIDELRQHVQTVNCSNCGGPVDLTRQAACGHCGSPLSMLDLKQAEKLVAQLQQAADLAAGREIRPVTAADRRRFLLAYLDLLQTEGVREPKGFRHRAGRVPEPGRAAGHDRWVIGKLRALVAWFTKGLEDGSRLRLAVNQAESMAALRDAIDEFFGE